MLWAVYEADFGWRFLGAFDSLEGAHNAALQLQQQNTDRFYTPSVFVVHSEEEAGRIHQETGYYVVQPIPLNSLIP